MEQESACCPVCTLYMREGITLQSHLETHSKDKVIEALLRARNVNSTQCTPQSAEDHLHGQSCVAQNSGTLYQSKTHGSSQTKVTATVSYQQFVTNNASTPIPQYIQVVAPNNSPPLVPNHPFAFMPPLQPAPYVQTMYNPLYNPYIPQPYPMVHPIYTNMPFSSDVNPLMSSSQITSPVVASSPTPFTCPSIAPSTSQVTNSVVAPSISPIPSPVMAPSPTPFTSPGVASSTSQVIKPVVPPSISPIPSPVMAPSPTPFTSPGVSSTSQVTKPVLAPSISPIPSPVMAPSPTPFTSPGVASSTSQVIKPVVPPSISPIPSPVMAPSPTPFTSPGVSSTSQVTKPVLAPSISPIPSPVMAPSPTPFTSPGVASSTSQVIKPVVAPISPIENSVAASSTSQVIKPVVPPSISPLPRPVVVPSPTSFPCSGVASSTSQIIKPVLTPISPIPRPVVVPSPTPFTSSGVASSASQVTKPVVAPSPTPFTSSGVASYTSQVIKPVLAPISSIENSVVASTSQVIEPVVAPSISPISISVVAPSPTPFTSSGASSFTSQVIEPVVAPSISPISISVVAPSPTPFTSSVVASSTSQVIKPVVPPSISPIPSPVVAPSTSEDISGEMLASASKEFSSIASNATADCGFIRRWKPKKLKLSLKSNSESKKKQEKTKGINPRNYLRLDSTCQRIFRAKEQGNLSEILSLKSQRTDVIKKKGCRKTSVIAKVGNFKRKGENLKFKKKSVSSRKKRDSSATSVITPIPKSRDFMFKGNTLSEASYSPVCSSGPSLPPGVPLPSPETIKSAEVHLDPENSNIKSEFERDSEHTANVSKYSVSCERSASSLSVITDRNSAVVFARDAYVSNCSRYENISHFHSQNESPFLQLPFDGEANTRACGQQPETFPNVPENLKGIIFGDNQDRLIEYNREIPETVFEPYGTEQEEKALFNFDFANWEEDQKGSNTVIEKIFCEPDEFPLEDSLPPGMRDEEPEESDSDFTENAIRGSAVGENTNPGFKKHSSVIFLRNSCRGNSTPPLPERTPRVEDLEFYDSKSATYTDLQPATDNSVLGNFGMSASSNVNNFMEVDGVKIFFTAGNEGNMPLEPIVKYSTSKMDEPKVQDCVKPEKEKEREALVESVIHLASRTTPKGDFSGEMFNSFNSENNFEMRDLSPLSLSIRADESMPARGELSEQESLGAENTTWNLFRAEVVTKSERDLMSGNEFRSTIPGIEGGGGGGKSVKSPFWREDVSNLKKENANDNGGEDKSKKGPPRPKAKVFYCSECPEKFRSLRSKKKHLLEIHFDDLKKDYEPSPSSGIEPQHGTILKTDMTETKTESDVSARANQLIRDNLAKSRPSKAVERIPPCEIVRLCPHCRIPCTGLKKLKEHLKQVHGTSKFKCDECCELFEGEKEYNNHLQIHPLKCKHCGKSFTRTQGLKLHVKRHMTVKPYRCDQCPKTFVTRQKLDEHKNGHAGIKPLKCFICDRTFSRHSNLIQHRRLHHVHNVKKVKDFVCRCGEIFHSASKLMWHKEVHEAKPKSCPFCPQKFVHKNSVTRHVRRSHLPHYLPQDKKDADNIQCPICGKIYLRSSLMVHLRTHSGEKPYSCKVCTKSFTTKWNMEIHSWTHQSRNSYPYRCIQCNSAFYREIDYLAHLNAHRNFRPFTCNVCGQRFMRKYNCIRHEEEHRTEKKFSCSVIGCDKTFHRSYYLKDHLKVHSGVRPHTCHICGKSSTTKSNHNKHIRIHDTRDPLSMEA